MTATAFTHAPVLRRIAGDAPIESHAALAAEFGRDPSNLRKTLQALEGEGLILRPEGERPTITDKGRQVLQGVDVAEGAAAGGADAGPPARWPIDRIRRNPANREISVASVLDMIDAVVGFGDIIQPLTLTPPDANGVRTILAGERRWRATAMLSGALGDAALATALERTGGAGLPEPLRDGLPFVEREADDATAILITIVENSAREDLSPWDDAQQLLRLAEATGWSGAEVARRTGRLSETRKNGAKDVQDKLKIAREATPDAIAEYRRTGSWDDLRNSVRDRKPVEADPDQLPMFEEPLTEWERQQRDRIWPACDALKPKQLLVLLETADRSIRHPYSGMVGRGTICGQWHPDPTGVGDHLVRNIGFGFGSGGGKPNHAMVGATSWDWLVSKGYLTDAGVVPYRLGLVRQEALGIGKEAQLRESGLYWTSWLNPDADGHAEIAEPSTPATADLSPLARLALVELTLKIARDPQRVDGNAGLNPDRPLCSVDLPGAWTNHGAPVGAIWIGSTFSELYKAGLVRAVHQKGGAPTLAALTDAGVAFLGDALPPAPGAYRAALAAAAPDQAFLEDRTWVTDWLEFESAPPAPLPAPRPLTPAEQAACALDDFGRDADAVAADAALLADVLALYHDDAEEPDEAAARVLMARLNIAGPFEEDGDGGLMAQVDGKTETLAFIDVDRTLPDDRSRAAALLIAWACRVVFGAGATTDGGQA